MKLFIKVFFLILFVVSCNYSTKNKDLNHINSCVCSDLILDELYNHFYLKQRTDPFTGICNEYYKNGRIKFSKELTNGKVDGALTHYRKDGSIRSIAYYKQNKINGKSIIYSISGEDSLVNLYKNGKLKIEK